MKKCINILLVIFICFSILPINYTAAYNNEVIDIKEENENPDNYSKAYKINELTTMQIGVNGKSRASKQNIKYLAVFIEFSDSDTNVKNHLDDPECVANAERIFNSDELLDMETVNGNIKVPSFKKYYETQSYGKMSITTEIFPKSNGKVEAYRDPHKMGYYLKYSETNPIGYTDTNEALQRETELINNAVNYVSNQISSSGITASDIDTGNDGIVDAISFFIEGNNVLASNIGWGDLLWSHMRDNQAVQATILGKRVSVYNIIYTYDYSEIAGVFSFNRSTYGTIIHEFGHTLGYMDLYRFEKPANRPVGFYDIMGNTIGSNPQNFLTYFISEYRNETNWHEPLPIISQTTQNITLNKPKFVDTNEKRAIKIQEDNNSQEYFIVEYHEKQNTYSESSADESGIIIYRVNEKNKFSGNREGGFYGENDHIFVFRPNETALGDAKGDLSQATLNKNRSHFGKDIKDSNDGFDNQTIYYSDGSNSGLVIDVIDQTDETVTFNITFPEVQGSGTKEDPYLIYDTDSYFYLMQRNTEGKYYKLIKDIDFINVKNYPKIDFKGNLDGNNKTISNITVTGAGVFYNIGDYGINSVIENLNVENINCEGDGNHLGGLASVVLSANLKNIHMKSGSVSNIVSINQLSSTGGFAGSIYNTVFIENCSSALDVISENNVGGFIGINSNAKIKNCYVEGKTVGNSNVGGFIGIQMIRDTIYNIPENAYYNQSKNNMNAVGGYAGYLHDLNVLPANELGKGIIGISVPEVIILNKNETTNYQVTTNPNTAITFSISSSDDTVIQCNNKQMLGVKTGSAKIYVDIIIGQQIMKMESNATVNENSSPEIEKISEKEVLDYFGLTKKNGYVIGFTLGSDVASIKEKLSSHPKVKLYSFKNSKGDEISTGIIATNMKFTLIFNQTEYNYTVVIKGDVNGDGKIYATDYVSVRNHIMSKTPLEGAYLLAADINNDNNIYATDYVRIRNYIMKNEPIEQK